MIRLHQHVTRALQLTFVLGAFAIAQAASAAKDKSIIVEFSGLDPTEVLTIKLENGEKLQTATGGSDAGSLCESPEETIIIDKELDTVSAKLAEATALGRVFDHVIVYRGNSQILLENALITAYSVSGSVGGPALETITLSVVDISAGKKSNW